MIYYNLPIVIPAGERFTGEACNLTGYDYISFHASGFLAKEPTNGGTVWFGNTYTVDTSLNIREEDKDFTQIAPVDGNLLGNKNWNEDMSGGYEAGETVSYYVQNDTDVDFILTDLSYNETAYMSTGFAVNSLKYKTILPQDEVTVGFSKIFPSLNGAPYAKITLTTTSNSEEIEIYDNEINSYTFPAGYFKTGSNTITVTRSHIYENGDIVDITPFKSNLSFTVINPSVKATTLYSDISAVELNKPINLYWEPFTNNLTEAESYVNNGGSESQYSIKFDGNEIATSTGTGLVFNVGEDFSIGDHEVTVSKTYSYNGQVIVEAVTDPLTITIELPTLPMDIAPVITDVIGAAHNKNTTSVIFNTEDAVEIKWSAMSGGQKTTVASYRLIANGVQIYEGLDTSITLTGEYLPEVGQYTTYQVVGVDSIGTQLNSDFITIHHVGLTEITSVNVPDTFNSTCTISWEGGELNCHNDATSIIGRRYQVSFKVEDGGYRYFINNLNTKQVTFDPEQYEVPNFSNITFLVTAYVVEVDELTDLGLQTTATSAATYYDAPEAITTGPENLTLTGEGIAKTSDGFAKVDETNDVTLSWDPPSSGYMVDLVYTVQDSDGNVYMTGGQETSCKVEAPTEGIIRIYTVTASDSTGASEESSVKCYNPAVVDFYFEDLPEAFAKSVTFEWNHPTLFNSTADISFSYKVEMQRERGWQWYVLGNTQERSWTYEPIVNVNEDGTTTVQHDLIEGTRVRFRITVDIFVNNYKLDDSEIIISNYVIYAPNGLIIGDMDAPEVLLENVIRLSDNSYLSIGPDTSTSINWEKPKVLHDVAVTYAVSDDDGTSYVPGAEVNSCDITFPVEGEDKVYTIKATTSDEDTAETSFSITNPTLSDFTGNAPTANFDKSLHLSWNEATISPDNIENTNVLYIIYYRKAESTHWNSAGTSTTTSFTFVNRNYSLLTNDILDFKVEAKAYYKGVALGDSKEAGLGMSTYLGRSTDAASLIEKLARTKIQLKYDISENWILNNPILLPGEWAIATVPMNDGTLETIIKIGDGVSHYIDLDFASVNASDVYEWAKQKEKPTYNATEIEGLAVYIENYGVDTDTKHSTAKIDDYTFKLQKTPTNGELQDIEESEQLVVIPYDDQSIFDRLTTVEGLVGQQTVMSDYEVDVVESESPDFAKVYNIIQEAAGLNAAIEIPKDLVLESGEVVTDPEGHEPGKYIQFNFVNDNPEAPLLVAVNKLVEYVTSGSGETDQLVVHINEQQQATMTLTDGTVTYAQLTKEAISAFDKAGVAAKMEETILDLASARPNDTTFTSVSKKIDNLEVSVKTLDESLADIAETGNTNDLLQDENSVLTLMNGDSAEQFV